MEYPLMVNASTLLHREPAITITYITVLSLASVLGSVGNLLVITSAAVLLKRSRDHTVHGYAFICNLACSDIIVTSLINPFAILGVIYGEEELYGGRFGLCRFLASICIISCVVSLLSIGCIATNRYLYICHHTRHSSIITRRSSVVLCVLTWLAGFLLDLPSHLSWSRHAFDAKTQKCFWDRRYNYYYSVLFCVAGIISPLLCITSMYGRIFCKVMASKNAMASYSNNTASSRSSSMMKALQQTKMMFVVFVAFAVCWTPYVCVLLLDKEDTFSHSVHLVVSMTAHVHASVNFIIYGVRDHVLRNMYRRILCNYILRQATSSFYAVPEERQCHGHEEDEGAGDAADGSMQRHAQEETIPLNAVGSCGRDM